MQVDLNPEELEIDIDDAKFVFSDINYLTVLPLVTAQLNGTSSAERLIELCANKLSRIDGIQTKDGVKVEPKHFKLLPETLISQVVAQFSKEVYVILGLREAEEKNEEAVN